MRGVRVRGAGHEEFVCEVVDELADWDHLEMNVKVWYGSAPGKVPYNTEAFWLIDLQVTIIPTVPIGSWLHEEIMKLSLQFFLNPRH